MTADNQFVVYYDAELAKRDGNGWCVDPLVGSTTYRFEKMTELCQFIKENATYLKGGK